MLWFYTRDEQSLRLETRYDNDTQEYVAIVLRAGGQPETKRFTTGDAFHAWLRSLEQTLTAEHWASDGSPHILLDGWPDKTPPR